MARSGNSKSHRRASERTNEMKYKKKPVVVEAITFGDLLELKRNSLGVLYYNGHTVTVESDLSCAHITTLEGVMKMLPSDMLMTGVRGEVYPCKRDIFEATYEPA
jgi:hypothetical protein